MHGEKILYFNFVVTPRNFIIAKLSIRKPGVRIVKQTKAQMNLFMETSKLHFFRQFSLALLTV